MESHKPIIIIGAGFVGLACALFLKQKGISSLILEIAQDASSFASDPRTFALSASSLDFLKQLGLLEKIHKLGKEIQTLHVVKQGSPILELPASLIKQKSLGLMISAASLHGLLLEALNSNHSGGLCEVQYGTQITNITKQEHTWQIQSNKQKQSLFHTDFLVAADGSPSTVANFLGLKPYIMSPMYHIQLAHLLLNRPLENQAYEFLLGKDQSAALLPLPQGTNHEAKFVLIQPHAEISEYNEPDVQSFRAINRILSAVNYQAQIQKQHRYSIQASRLLHPAIPQTVFLGNAANTLIPIGAQGLNLGLRDVKDFVKLYLEKGLKTSQDYTQARSEDVDKIYDFTQSILKQDLLESLLKSPCQHFLRTGSGW
ncbi:MAG: FAD-dependent monooxygenase [Gammaproteobacteria bacterium]